MSVDVSMPYDAPQYEPVSRNLPPPTALPHYYGDIVRKLFMAAGVIMLISLPFFREFLPVPTLLSLAAILIVSIVAGLTNPMQRWVMALDSFTALVGLFAFEYYAISRYGDIPWLLFGTDQLLAIIFFFALYYSVKTFRGTLVSDYAIRERKRSEREKKERASWYRHS